jgi:hypothetical protein
MLQTVTGYKTLFHDKEFANQVNEPLQLKGDIPWNLSAVVMPNVVTYF